MRGTNHSIKASQNSTESGMNRDLIEKVGEEIQNSLDGKALQGACVKRKDMVKTLENLKCGAIIEKKTIHISIPSRSPNQHNL